MAGARLTVDLDPVRDAIGRLAAAGRETRGLMDAIGAHVEARTAERFESESGPGGTKWPPSLRARTEGGQTLTDTGRLRASIGREATDTTATVGTNVVYAAIHQFGGTITKYAQSRPIYRSLDAVLTQRREGGRGPRFVSRQRATLETWHAVGGHTVTMPARPFLGVDDEDRAAIGAIVADWVARAVPEATP